MARSAAAGGVLRMKNIAALAVVVLLATTVLHCDAKKSRSSRSHRNEIARSPSLLHPADHEIESEADVLESAKRVKVFLAQDETWPPFREKISHGRHARWNKYVSYEEETGFGAKVTPEDIKNFGEDHVHRRHLHGHSLGILAILASRGWLFRTDEYNLGGLFMHRLLRSQSRAHRVQDANIVVNAGCSNTYDAMVQEEDSLLHHKKIHGRRPRFTVVGTSFVFPLKWIMTSKCSKDNWHVIFDNALHRNPFAFRVPYPTIVHTTGGALVSDLEFIFEFHDRPNLLSFYGTIEGSVALTRARKRFVSKLVAGRHEPSLNASVQGTPVKGIFTFPFVILPEEAIVHPSDQANSDEKIGRLDRKKEFGQLFGFALYAESQFCLQPPGDAAMRRGVYDSIIAGCIPVIYSQTVGRYASMFNGLVYRTLGIKVTEVFWIIDPNTDATKVYNDMIDAVKSGETTRRRKLLAKVADYFHYAYEDNDKDAFLLLLEAMRRYSEMHGEAHHYSMHVPGDSDTEFDIVHNPDFEITTEDPVTSENPDEVDESEDMEEGGIEEELRSDEDVEKALSSE